MSKELTKAGLILKNYRDLDHDGLREQARKLGISPSYLCDISYGNRNMTPKVLQQVKVAYKYRCAGNDLSVLASACFDEELIHRYKLRTHKTDNDNVVLDLIYIFSGIVV